MCMLGKSWWDFNMASAMNQVLAKASGSGSRVRLPHPEKS